MQDALSSSDLFFCMPVAQLAEQRSPKPQVGGSIPSRHANLNLKHLTHHASLAKVVNALSSEGSTVMACRFESDGRHQLSTHGLSALRAEINSLVMRCIGLLPSWRNW